MYLAVSQFLSVSVSIPIFAGEVDVFVLVFVAGKTPVVVLSDTQTASAAIQWLINVFLDVFR